MITKISPLSKMLLLSIGFSMALLLVRVIYADSLDYSFYIWNSFLAAIPYAISTQIAVRKKLDLLTACLLILWLLYFPNAPYMITNIFHYEKRFPVPFWYDLILVIIGAWNGMILGMASLMNVEKFLSQHLKTFWVTLCEFFSLLLCSYGIFIGRFLRFNSWDVVSDPGSLLYTSAHHVLVPQNYAKLWAFTLLFAALLGLIYFTLKKLPLILAAKNKQDPGK